MGTSAITSKYLADILKDLKKYYELSTQNAVSSIYEMIYILSNVKKFANFKMTEFAARFFKVQQTAKKIDEKCLLTYILDLENRSKVKTKKQDFKHLLQNLDYYEKGAVLAVKYEHRISKQLFILLSLLNCTKYDYFQSVVQELIPRFQTFDIILKNFQRDLNQKMHSNRKRKRNEMSQIELDKVLEIGTVTRIGADADFEVDANASDTISTSTSTSCGISISASASKSTSESSLVTPTVEFIDFFSCNNN